MLPQFKFGNYNYLGISIKSRPLRVHVLVAETYIGPRPPGHYCCHLDGNKYNNSVKNLVWATPKENYAHRYIHGTDVCGERSPRAKLTNAQAKEIRRRFIKGANGIKRGNCLDLAREYKVSGGTIWRIATNRSYKTI
jgi:hypothetical protein